MKRCKVSLMKNKLTSFTKSYAKDYKKDIKKKGITGHVTAQLNHFHLRPSLALLVQKKGETYTSPTFSQFVTMLTIQKKSESWKLKKVLEEDESPLRPYSPPSLFPPNKKKIRNTKQEKIRRELIDESRSKSMHT
ncbi:hypothetical protein NPIL_697981 [Nephila pilipes]|uniref:Uncharacterized protein n=1 Tax=Nephila pilipes TaxID=299642 RepID=A0A8X6QVK6_NEPPI|nr:hypothetical protein NPIL_697981 [Nephila pilipes]